MFMATLSMMEKDPAKADDYLAKAVISAPKNSQALMTLAQMRLGAGKNAEALKLAQRAAAISPEDPQVQHTLAQALVANGDKTQAITLWRGLLKDPSLSPELLITIANTIQTLDPGLGLEFANRCHAMSPENPWTMLMLARLQFLNKQTDQAKKNCAEAKRQAQSLGDARLLKACETLEIELLRPKP
jgi:predicted Zn-dependent protease